MQSPPPALLPPLIEFPRPIWDKGRTSEEWRIPISRYFVRAGKYSGFSDVILLYNLRTAKARNLVRVSSITLQNGNTVEIGRLVTPPRMHRPGHSDNMGLHPAEDPTFFLLCYEERLWI